jgi:hypothetical protein
LRIVALWIVTFADIGIVDSDIRILTLWIVALWIVAFVDSGIADSGIVDSGICRRPLVEKLNVSLVRSQSFGFYYATITNF